MKRILVNATQREELRVAIVDGQRLCNLDIESTSLHHKKGDIYKGVVTSVAPGLNAVFVDYGGARHGFLPFREIAREHLPNGRSRSGNTPIKDAIRVGDAIPVQIAREERGDKGALLTTYISLVSRYLVLMPDNPRARGVSQRIEGSERKQAQEAAAALDRHEDEGVIVRTSGTGRDAKDLQADLDYLRRLWEALQGAVRREKAPSMIYRESNIVVQALRDYLADDIGSVVIDSRETFDEAKKFVSAMMSDHAGKLRLYEGTVPLFSHAQIERQIEDAFERTISLPSGGSLVIDHAEALTTIDINSARSMRGSDIEETALATNLEAAEEIALQMRLRDLGGLIVIDFIDMVPVSSQRKVEDALRRALKSDRARIQMGRISRFGLLEMSRQRLRPSLGDTARMVCPRCSGTAFIRTPESCALAVMRLVEEEALKESVTRVMVQVPVEVCDFIVNKKRSEMDAIEQQHKVRITVMSDIQMETPHYKVTGKRDDETVVHVGRDEAPPDLQAAAASDARGRRRAPRQRPAVTMFSVSFPGLLQRFFKRISAVFSLGSAARKEPARRRGRRRTSAGDRRDMPRRFDRGRRQGQQGRSRNNDRRPPQGARRASQAADSARAAADSTTAEREPSRRSGASGRPQRQSSPRSSRQQESFHRRQEPSQRRSPQRDAQASARKPDAPRQEQPASSAPVADAAGKQADPAPVSAGGQKQAGESAERPQSRLPMPSVGIAKAPSDSSSFQPKPGMVQVETRKPRESSAE